MQYLLSEEEYTCLCGRPAKVEADKNKVILELCKRVACDEGKPFPPERQSHAGFSVSRVHGCILVADKENGRRTSIYCEGCPVIKECPYEYKEYGQ